MVFKKIKDAFTNDLLVEISKEKVVIKRFGHKPETMEVLPLIALSKKVNKGRSVIAIGDKAKQYNGHQNVEIIKIFNHPRTLIHDFFITEKFFQLCLKELHKGNFLSISPRIIVQQLGFDEGGLTMVESRCIREVFQGAGGREVMVYSGHRIQPQIETLDSIITRNEESGNVLFLDSTSK